LSRASTQLFGNPPRLPAKPGRMSRNPSQLLQTLGQLRRSPSQLSEVKETLSGVHIDRPEFHSGCSVYPLDCSKSSPDYPDFPLNDVELLEKAPDFARGQPCAKPAEQSATGIRGY